MTGEAFAWSPDGTCLACIALEEGKAVVQVWDAHLGQRLFTCQRVPGAPLNISWSPNGTLLAAGYATDQRAEAITTLQFWETQRGKVHFSYQAPGFPHQLLWSPDSHVLATITSQADPSHSCALACHGTNYHEFLQVFQVG